MSGLAKGLTEDQVLRRVVEKVCEQVWSQDETAIKKALAQPEHMGFMDSKLNPIQRTWVPLTDEEVQLYAVQHCRMVNTHYDSAQNTNLITEEFDAPAFYKTIEAALRSKNT